MILLGYDDADARAEVVRYCETHPIRRVVVLTSERFRPAWSLPVPHEVVAWPDLIRYVFFYRLLQEIDGDTLVVVYECLRTQDRHDLTYNCVRNYLAKTSHVLVFQHVLIIDTFDDAATLLDFVTGSRWKRERVEVVLARARGEGLVVRIADGAPTSLRFDAIPVETTAEERDAYAREKRTLIDNIGLRDPHTIPRNLALLGGRAKLRWHRAHGVTTAGAARRYLGRNARLGLDVVDTWESASRVRGPYAVMEFAHRFLDVADAITATGQARFDVLVTDLKVDGWYFDRAVAWAGRVRDAYAALRT